jgi:hypothetical protein
MNDDEMIVILKINSFFFHFIALGAFFFSPIVFIIYVLMEDYFHGC